MLFGFYYIMKGVSSQNKRRIILKSISKYFDFLSVFKYCALLCLFLTLNCLEKTVLPYSSAMLCACLYLGANVFLCPLLYVCSFIMLGQTGLLSSIGIFALFLFFVSFIYQRFSVRRGYEFVLYCLVGLLGFVFLGNSAYPISLEKRIFTTLLTTLLTFIAMVAGKATCKKGLKFKLGFEEFFSIAVVLSLVGLGLSNLVSPLLWKGISVFLILLAVYVYKTGLGAIISAVFGISLSIYYGNLNLVSVFLLYGVFAESLMGLSRYASAISVIVCDYLVQLTFSVYPDYSYVHFISVLIGSVCFCITPTKIIKNLKEKLYSFREKQLVRQSINTNRTVLSSRLYDLSGVFMDMANAFHAFKRHNLSEDGAKQIMQKEIYEKVCSECDNFARCKRLEKQKQALSKMIDIGFAKGKLSLIDFPSELSSTCSHPNNVLFCLNRLLADYRSKLIENANLETGRDLIAKEALGVAEILRSLALESGALLKFHNRLERAVCDGLQKAGFIVTELLLYGEEDRLSVSLILAMKEFSLSTLQSLISKMLGQPMCVCEQNYISDQKIYLSLKRANEFDAVFGISRKVKDGSEISGDTHSIVRLSNDRFLVALSDGMGSGRHAESVSSASLSLIESFYKAGLNQSLILDTVNKLLSINTEDCFTALDVFVFDLNSCSADFIKYGSPYGFIISDGGIKIVEGNSLPLGIIESLKPAVATTTLSDGDMVLLVTDGISDAFGSSGEIIDFLRSVPAKNPQSLADEILNHALSLSGQNAKDDMTALAVRIYKKAV